MQPRCHFRRTNIQAFTVLPGTHLLLGGESARVSKVPCLGAHRRSRFSLAQPEFEPAISRLYVAHATTEPRRPTVLTVFVDPMYCGPACGRPRPIHDQASRGTSQPTTTRSLPQNVVRVV